MPQANFAFARLNSVGDEAVWHLVKRKQESAWSEKGSKAILACSWDANPLLFRGLCYSQPVDENEVTK